MLNQSDITRRLTHTKYMAQLGTLLLPYHPTYLQLKTGAPLAIIPPQKWQVYSRAKITHEVSPCCPGQVNEPVWHFDEKLGFTRFEEA